MPNTPWRKGFAVLRNRLYLYPPPELKPYTRWSWLALGVVALLAALYAGYFIAYMVSSHNAYLTHAEDLGTMDQAIWSILHGPVFHQTVCNIVSDTNCYSINGISRFAIHFEPILFPVSLLYLLWPDAKTLLVLQTLVVAAGAFPAFWLARLRLRNDLAAVAIALLYLLYPMQQQAVTFDFHAVTFTASLLLFVLYFMYTRRTIWMFAFAILAMACKEEIPVVVAVYGLWSVIFQQRWRSGLGLVGLSVAWVGVYFLVEHLASPTGHSLLTPRYSDVSSLLLHPKALLQQYILEPQHIQYLKLLLSPAAYLPLLAPWIFVLAVPTLALNMLSSDPQQYSGLFQYNAEMVPVLIFATIEAIVLILWVLQRLFAPFYEPQRVAQPSTVETESQQNEVQSGQAAQVGATTTPLPVRLLYAGVLAFLLLGITFTTAREDYLFNGKLPFSQGFQWPQTTAHTQLAQKFIDEIPDDESVSAQSALLPHISHRQSVYLFPYGDEQADYIFLDISGDVYPFYGSVPYTLEVKRILMSGEYGIKDAQDGYLLLEKGLPPPGISPASVTQNSKNLDVVLPNLPDSLCTYIQTTPGKIVHSTLATFTSADGASSMNLVGYNVSAASPFSLAAGYMQVTTDWQLLTPTMPSLLLQVLVADESGAEHLITTDFPAQFWCPTNTWKPGMILQLSSMLFQIKGHSLKIGD
ncbi:MAG TPA: DUF2079 domain-containing protein, partial [Ktedonobacteraceae bacterium]|nr:DUF2079 domain-containing protein [Ktedonobacteraceae bacterium]